MANKPAVILVKIESVRDWHVATSDDMNNFFMALPNLGDLIKDIPNVIKALYKAQHGVDVEVKEGGSVDNHSTMPLRYVMEPKVAA